MIFLNSLAFSIIQGICKWMLQWVAIGNLPNPGVETMSPAIHMDFLPSETPWKPKNPGMGNLSLLQGNFATQGLNPHLHCRWILYKLSQKRKCYIFLWSSSDLKQYHLKFFFFLWYSVCIICSLMEVGVKVLYYYYVVTNISLYACSYLLYTFSCCYGGCILFTLLYLLTRLILHLIV